MDQGNNIHAKSWNGATHFMGQILISKCPIFAISTFGENLHFLDANYSMKQ